MKTPDNPCSPREPRPALAATVRPFALSALLLSGASASLLFGQTASPEPAIQTLQPFEVHVDKADSYEALNFNSLSGTNRSLDKLPITAEVYNSTLLSDLAITDVTQLLTNYATGIVPGEASPASSGASGGAEGDRFNLSGFGIRGLNSGAVRRNGFLSFNNLGDSFEVERMEIIRGPQSLLYGTNPAGGVINAVTKKAIFGRTFYTPSIMVDNFGTRRYQLDANVSGTVMDRRVPKLSTMMEGV